MAKRSNISMSTLHCEAVTLVYDTKSPIIYSFRWFVKKKKKKKKIVFE